MERNVSLRKLFTTFCITTKFSHYSVMLKKTEANDSSGNCFLRSEVRLAVALLALQSDQWSCLLLAGTENAGLTLSSIGFTFLTGNC